jgi:5'(3')-deoxyribonucleotidase
MKPIVIGFDVDDVLAALIEEWVTRYNFCFFDEVKPSDIRSWSISDFCKKASHDQLFGLLEHPELYESVEMIPGALETVQWCRAQKFEDGTPKFRVVFVTSCTSFQSAEQKFHWLWRNGFFGEEYKPKYWPARARLMNDLFAVKDKHMVSVDILVDDNLTNCQHPTAKCFLFNRHHNEDHSAPMGVLRVFGHVELREVVAFVTGE